MTTNPNDLVSKKFKRKSPQDRLNAETIRQFMHDFVSEEFDRNFAKAAASLNSLPVKNEDRRGFRNNLSKSSIETAIQDSRPITYAHIDAIARFYKIPVSALLLFTRARDEMETVEQRKRGDVRRVLVAMRTAIDHIERLADEIIEFDGELHDRMGHAEFMEYAEKYRQSFDGIFL